MTTARYVGSAWHSLKEEVMKRVIFAVLLTALALFLILTNLSWGF